MTKSKAKTAALILNGEYIPPVIDGGYILCADGGYNLLKSAGLKCGAVLGDCDSVRDLSPDIKLIPFETDKNETDGHLAVLYLIDAGFKKINIYGALGGRPDQVAGNINLLAIARAAGADAVIRGENADIYFIADGESFNLQCKKGDVISVLPYTENIAFKGSTGLKYPLDGLTAERLSSRGISNAATETNVTIDVKTGKAFLYVIKNANQAMKPFKSLIKSSHLSL